MKRNLTPPTRRGWLLCSIIVLPLLAIWSGPLAGGGHASDKLSPADASELQKAGVKVAWRGEFDLLKDEQVASVHYGAGILVGITDLGRIVAMDARRGLNLWASRIAERSEKIFPPAFHREMVYIVTTRHLYGFRADNGAEEFKIRLDFAPSGTPVSNGKFCYIPSAGGHLKAVALPAKDEESKAVSWERWTPTAVISAAALTDTRVFFADWRGNVYFSRLDDRDVVECFKANGPIEADLRVYNNSIVLVPSVDYLLYGLGATTGMPMWKYYASNPIYKPAYLKDKQVFVFAEGEGLAALDARSGERLWQVKEAVDFIAAGENVLLAAGSENKLLGIARKDGKVVFTVALHEKTLWVNNEIDATGYLSLPSGQVMAITR